jgi:triosephosphate isomerase
MSRRIPIVAANWKMHTTVRTAAELCQVLRESIDGVWGVEKVICPPFVFLGLARGAGRLVHQGGGAERLLGGEGRLYG